MQIKTIASSNGMNQNSYIVYSNTNIVLIDAGCDQSVLKITLKELNLSNRRIDGVILTHTHFDHIYGLFDIYNEFNCPIYVHAGCSDFLFDKIKNASCYFADFALPEVIKNNLIELTNNQILTIGDLTFKIYFTPGHSKCSICILIDNIIFTGDTILLGSVGRTDLFGGSIEELQNSLKLIQTLNYVTAYPGHGRELSKPLTDAIIKFNTQ